MNGADIVRAAIPQASDQLVNHVLWARTPFPMGPVTAQELYRAASAYRRAAAKSVELCDWCHRIATITHLCERCHNALQRAVAMEKS